jgi:Protein of unknown function (DUF3501)
MTKLTLDDISDQRAYEREREEFRRDVIQLKQRRRVAVGEFVTLLFENRQTIRFQIQEMARIEKLIGDDAIETELRTYNPLIPDPGQLCATLFIELTSEDALMEWLPKLVDIEWTVGLRLSDGEVVGAVVDEDHAKQLTRDEITASVHYVRWDLSPAQIERFVAGPVTLVVDHPAYADETALGDDTLAELRHDLQRGG